MAPLFPLGAQFWRGVREPGCAARQVLGQVEGGERRARVAQRHELRPAGFARARSPSLACGAAQEELAGEKRQRRCPTEGLGQRGVGAIEGKRLGVGPQRDHRFGSRGRGDWGRPIPGAPTFRRAAASLPRPLSGRAATAGRRRRRRGARGEKGRRDCSASGTRRRPVPPVRAPGRASRGRSRPGAPPRPRVG